MANELEKVLLTDSQAPVAPESTEPEPTQPRPVAPNLDEQQQRDAARAAQVFGGVNNPVGNFNLEGTPVFYGRSKDHFTRGVKAGVQGVKSSFSGLAAMGNLIMGDDMAAKRRLAEVDDYNERVEKLLEPLETFEDFILEPTLQGGFNQLARAVGQNLAPAGLVLGEALAGGIILGAGRTAFTVAGRAALQDAMSKTIRKAGNFKDKVLKPNKDDVLQLGGPNVDFERQTVNAFEELWFKTLRNKGTDNLTPEEKVVMDTARGYIRDLKRGAVGGAFIASEKLIAPEILQEYRDAGIELTAREAVMAGLIGLPAAGVEVLSDAIFFGSLFKLATGRSRLAGLQQKFFEGKKLSEHEKFILKLSLLAEKKGIDAIGKRGQAELRLFEKKSTLALLGDVARVGVGSIAAEGFAEGVQEEIIMSVGNAVNPDFDNAGTEARLRRMQAWFDGAAGGGARGVAGGAGAAIFQKARATINNKVEDLAWQNVQQETFKDLEELGLPETFEDVVAQLQSMIDPDYKRESVWLTLEFLKANGIIDPETNTVNKTKLRELLQDAFAGKDESSIPEIMLSLDKDGLGVLLTVSKDARTFFDNQRFNSVNLRDVLTRILDFTETSSSAQGEQVIVQLLEDDKVVWEQTAPSSSIPEVVIQADSQFQPEKKYSVMKNSMDPEIVKELLPEAQGPDTDDEDPQLDLFDPETVQPLIDELEGQIFDYQINDKEVPQSLLDRYDSLKSKKRNIKIAITTPEEEAERRLESYKNEDGEEEVKRRSMEYSGEFEDDYNETLEELKAKMEQEGGYTDENFGDVVEGSEFDFAQQFSEIGKITVQSGRVATAWKKREVASFDNEKSNDELRDLISTYYRQTTEALIRLTSVYPSADNAASELSRFNEKLITLNAEIGKLKNNLNKAENSKLAKSIRRVTNEILDENLRADPNKTRTQLETPERARKELSSKIAKRLKYKKQELAAFLNSIQRTKDTIAQLDSVKQQTEEDSKKLIAKLDMAQERNLDRDTEARATERLILGELGLPPKKASAIANSNSREFLNKIAEQLDRLEQRVRDEIKVIEPGDELPVISSTSKEAILKAIAEEENKIDAIAEGIGEDDVRQLATERVIARTEVDGLPLKSFLGMYDTPVKTAARMSEYLDMGELSFVDQELLRNANSSILKVINELQAADPNSIYKIVPTDVIKTVGDKPLIDKGIKTIVTEFFDVLEQEGEVIGATRPDEIDLYSFQNYVEQIKQELKVQGGQNKLVPMLVIEQKFGKQSVRGFREFIKIAGPSLGLEIDTGYQSIIKESTPETEPDLYADKFRDMTPKEAVQSMVTSAVQIQNRVIENRLVRGSRFETTDVRFLEQDYKAPSKKTLKFGWYLRGGKNDLPLSFNELLTAGRSILEANMDSIEKANTELNYRTALGFAVLVQRFLTNFKNKNGESRKFVFKYYRGKNQTPGEVVLESLDQPLPDDLLEYLNPHVELSYFNGATLSTLDLRTIATSTSPTELLDKLKNKKEFEIDSKAEIRAKLPADKSAGPPKTKTTNLRTFDIFNLPLYFNPALQKYQSAKDMILNFTQAPFNYKSDGTPKGKYSPPDIIKSNIDARKKLLNPNLDSLKNKDRVDFLEPAFQSNREIDLTLRNMFLDELKLNMKDVRDYAELKEAFDFTKLKVKEIVTGGQIGVDLIATRVANELGFPTITLAGSPFPYEEDAPNRFKTEYKGMELLFHDFFKREDEALEAIGKQRTELAKLIDDTEKAKKGIKDKLNKVANNIFKGPTVTFHPLKNIANLEKEGKGINVMRKRNTNEHYGNPFTHLKTKTAAEVQVKDLDEAVQSYRDWLLNKKHQDVQPEQRKWIQDQISQGKLNGQTLLYYSSGNKKKNHANVLRDVVNRRQEIQSKPKVFKDSIEDVKLEKGAFTQDSSFEKLDSLLTEYKDQVKTTGGRRALWFGEVNYNYTGTSHKSLDMPNEIRAMAEKLAEKFNYDQGYFNSVLINSYPTGRGIPAHRDDEAIFIDTVGVIGGIATVSYGGDSTITVADNKNSKEVNTSNGDAYLMPEGRFQFKYTHQVGPASAPRISLTFRHVPTSNTQIVSPELTQELSQIQALAQPLREFPGYNTRTEVNVRYSDGVIIFADNGKGGLSPGSRLTKELAQLYKKPILINPLSVMEMQTWAIRNEVETLMVAGSGVAEPSYRTSRSKELQEEQIGKILENINTRQFIEDNVFDIRSDDPANPVLLPEQQKQLIRSEAERIYAEQELKLKRMEDDKEIKVLTPQEVAVMNSVTPDWEQLFHNFMVSTNYLRTRSDLQKQLYNRALNDPENFALNVPIEKEYELLQDLLEEQNILNDDDYAQNVINNVDLYTDPREIDRGFTESVSFDDEPRDMDDPYRTRGNKSFINKVISQNINKERYEGRFNMESIKPGIFIEDDVTNTYSDVVDSDGRGVAKQILNLRRKRKGELTPTQEALLKDLQKQPPFAFKKRNELIPEDVLSLRRKRAQEANFDLARIGKVVDPIKVISDIAKDVLQIQHRSLFVMFDDNPIKFDSKKFNDQVEISRRVLRENSAIPEQIVTIGNVDIIVLRRPRDYFYKIKNNPTTKNIIEDEVEGLVLSSYEHALGHAYFHEWYDVKLMETTEEGRNLLKAFEEIRKDPNGPKQYKEDYGLEEFVGDQVGKLLNQKVSQIGRAKGERYTRSLVLRLRNFYRKTQNKMAKDVLGRTTGAPLKEFVEYHESIVEQFKGTYKDRGSGKQISMEFARDLADEVAKRRDMKADVFFAKIKENLLNGDPDKPNTYIKKTLKGLGRITSSNIRQLKATGVNPRFAAQIYRETGEEGDLGVIQEKDFQFRRIINSLFEGLSENLGIQIGTFFDDNLIRKEDITILNTVLEKAEQAIDAFSMEELDKQRMDPNYKTAAKRTQKSRQDEEGRIIPTGPVIDIQQGRADEVFPEYADSIYLVVEVLQRLKRLMASAGLRVMDNYDLRRNYKIDEIGVDDILQARLVKLLVKYNQHTGLSSDEARKAVRIMLQNREDQDHILMDEMELDPLVSAVSVGMAPKRANLFRNIPTHKLRVNGLIEPPYEAFKNSIRSMSLKFVFNNEVRHTLSDGEILRARALIKQGEISTPDGYTDDLRFLEPFAKIKTRDESFNEFGQVDESRYLMQGHMSATASIWLDPNVKQPFDATHVTSSILGKAGMSIDRWPTLRQFQAGMMLLNQVTFLAGSTISSIPEIAGPVIQRGDVESIVFLGRSIVKNIKNKEEATNLMRALGVMGISTAVEASVYAGDLGWATAKTREWSQAFFRSIGTTKFMNFIYRNAGLVSIMAIEADAKRAATGDRKAMDRLKTIGLDSIPPQELVAGMERLGVMKGDTPKSFNQIDKFFRSDPLGLQIREGLNKLSGEMVLRPNAAQRTVWMNNPFYALISQLKPFYYSFGKTYGEGTWKNMKRNYEYDGPISALLPLILLIGTMMPLAMLALEVRELLKYILKGGDPEVFRSDETPWPTYLFDVADRAGLPGRFGLLIPMFEADLYGDQFFTPLFGATFERAVDIIEGKGNIWDYVPYAGAVGYK